MNELDILARKYGTDKRTNDIGQNIYHGYTPIYYQYLNNKKHIIKNFLEIGIREGWSHKMWAEWLPLATIYGIDNFSDPACTIKKEDIETTQIKVIVGDQADEEVLNYFNNISLDVIIDDGSHRSWDQQKSFNILWDYLIPGGYYFIEDLAVCLIREFREFDDPNSSTLNWILNLKNNILFSHYISQDRLNIIINEIANIEIYGELAVIEKKKL